MRIIKYIIKKIIQLLYKCELRQLKNDNFSLFCNVCIGGIIYSNLKKQFLSPTINLWLTCDDFCKFLLNLDKYIESPIKFIGYDEGPIGVIDDIKIHFNHYKSIEDALNAWNRRKQRINKKNMYAIIRWSEESKINQNILNELNQKYKNIILISPKKLKGIKYKYIKCPNNEKDQMMTFTGLRYWELQFNYVKFLNKNKKPDF